MAQGRFLLDLGVDPATIPDPMRDYFCNAWLIGRHIIKVQFSPSPRKRHKYYITSSKKCRVIHVAMVCPICSLTYLPSLMPHCVRWSITYPSPAARKSS